MTESNPQNNISKQADISSVTEGDLAGTWFSCDTGSIGVVASDIIYSAPYICFYPPKPQGYPHSICVRDGDMIIQSPGPGGSIDGMRFLSINKLLDHLGEACCCDWNADEAVKPVQAPKPAGS